MIGEIPDETVRDLCKVAFAAIIVAVSKLDSDMRYVRRAKRIEPGDTVRRHLRQLDAAVAASKLDDLVEQRFPAEC